MKSVLILVAAVATLSSSPVLANADLAKTRNCLSCHELQGKKIGPGFKEIAAKYAGQKDAADKLSVKIKKGGSGAWGPVPMPQNDHVSEAEAKQLAAWVLTVK
jgi:cytochrome c